ncbi:hypothetical protein BD626DRAFT_584946 [Schizophyllum amplum]|uniref:F-box domain-containing protein n=1 Tax=Schizophyllum amplum TaxID=97359 RepID=A0A550C7N6_9AGAR|nr:hypothetical protein BD626DRAFT_584946 [Auriculariopsis ampla]
MICNENELESLKPYHPLGAWAMQDPCYARVCVEWRQVALSSPQLFKTIYLNDADLSPRNMDRFVCGISGYLVRSSQVPLCVNVDHTGNDEGFMENAVWRRLLEESHRWRTLSLRLDVACLRQIPPLDLPVLQVVDLFVGHTAPRLEGGSANSLPLLGLENAHGVRHASVQLAPGVFPDTEDLELPPSWHLTILILNTDFLDNMLQAIRVVGPTLDTLWVHTKHAPPLMDEAGQYLLPDQEGAVDLPVLKHLSTMHGGSDMIFFVHAPSLQSLAMRIPQTDCLDPLLRMIKRCRLQSTLTSLSIAAIQNPRESDYETLLECLRELTAVSSLSLRNTDGRPEHSVVRNRLISDLVGESGQSPCLPNLRSLSLWHGQRNIYGGYIAHLIYETIKCFFDHFGL